MPNLLHQLQASLPAATQQLCVALSGGLDSRVVFELACQLQQLQPNLKLRALHVHHQLSPNADSWATFALQLGHQAGVPVSIHKVDTNSWHRASLEDRARQARYQIFTQELAPGEVLLQGHHQDDKVETLLLRLMRGAGTQGLASIPAQRKLGAGLIVRPLLQTPRAKLLKFAQNLQLTWVEDESNWGTDYDRNFLRLKILPLLEQRFPQAKTNLARVTQLAAISQQLNADLAQQDLLNCQSSPISLHLPALKQLAEYRQINLLRFWLFQRGLTPPGHQLWDEFNRLYNAQDSAQPLLSWACQTGTRIQARRFQQQIFIAPDNYFQPLPDNWQTTWDGKSPLNTPLGKLNLQLQPLTTAPAVQQQFTVTGRRKGAVISLATRGKRDVKRLLQELNLPPWQRQQLVFIWQHKELLAVDKYLVAAGWKLIPTTATTSGQQTNPAG